MCMCSHRDLSLNTDRYLALNILILRIYARHIGQMLFTIKTHLKRFMLQRYREVFRIVILVSQKRGKRKYLPGVLNQLDCISPCRALHSNESQFA